MLNKYSIFIIFTLSIKLLTNISFISHIPKKQRRSKKETGIVTAILYLDFEKKTKSLKRVCLLLKLQKQLPNVKKIAMNVTKINSKISEPDI